MNNNILIGHLGWDGCHFLASCLAMSDDVYFNHYTLRGKMEYFFKNMSNIIKVDGKPVWSDVFMFYGSSYQSNGYVHYRQGLMILKIILNSLIRNQIKKLTSLDCMCQFIIPCLICGKEKFHIRLWKCLNRNILFV